MLEIINGEDFLKIKTVQLIAFNARNNFILIFYQDQDTINHLII